VITPVLDLETATDEQIIAAYIDMGFSESVASAYLAQLRGEPSSEFPVD